MRLVGTSLKAIEACGGLLGCRFDEENSGYDEKEQVSRSVFKRESPLTPFTSGGGTTLLLWWLCVLVEPWNCWLRLNKRPIIDRRDTAPKRRISSFVRESAVQFLHESAVEAARARTIHRSRRCA
jgi:hypothetical protein